MVLGFGSENFVLARLLLILEKSLFDLLHRYFDFSVIDAKISIGTDLFYASGVWI